MTATFTHPLDHTQSVKFRSMLDGTTKVRSSHGDRRHVSDAGADSIVTELVSAGWAQTA